MATMDEMLEQGEERAEQPRDEHGRFARAESEEAPPASEPEVTEPVEAQAEPEPDTPQTPPPEEPPKAEPREDLVPQAALLDERRKRQQYEQRLQELEAKLQAEKPAETEAPKDFWDDPQAFISASNKEAVKQAQAEMAHALRAQYATMCENLARTQYEDYDAVRDVFLERVQSDPVLRAELARADNPAQFAYSMGKRLTDLQQDPNAMREQMRKEIEAKVRAELGQQVPQSLNTETSPAATSEQWAGPTPLASVIGIKR